MEVEIVNNNIVFLPENTFEKEGIMSILCNIECESTDPKCITKRFEVSDEKLYERDLD